jgi:hypothetical protein
MRGSGEHHKHLNNNLVAKAQDILKYKKSFWKKLGDEISDKIRVDTISGKDVKGKAFKTYTTDYANRKASRKFKRQSSTSTKPDLQLTGDMMRNLQTRGATADGVTIGWSGTLAQRVQWNDDMGRTVTSTTKPLSDKIEKFAINQLGRITDANIKKYASKPINFKIGR